MDDSLLSAMPSMKQFTHLFPIIRSYVDAPDRRFLGVIFDLDDTLAPEAAFAFSGFRAVSQYVADSNVLQIESVFEIIKTLFIEGERMHIFDKALSSESAASSHSSSPPSVSNSGNAVTASDCCHVARHRFFSLVSSGEQYSIKCLPLDHWTTRSLDPCKL